MPKASSDEATSFAEGAAGTPESEDDCAPAVAVVALATRLASGEEVPKISSNASVLPPRFLGVELLFASALSEPYFSQPIKSS